MKSIAEERGLVEAAVQSAYGRTQLVEYLSPYLHGFAYAFLGHRDDVTDQELVGVALIPLDRAVQSYLRNSRESMFRAYYNWWARRAMLAYLRDNKSTRNIIHRKNEDD